MIPANRSRATWVWEPTDPRGLVAWAVSQGVRDLYLAVPRDPDPAYDEWLRAVTREAAGWSLRLLALGGDSGWCDHPAHAVAWTRKAMAGGRFAGVHLDLEAWAHPEWDRDRARVVAGYLATLDALRGRVPVLEVDLAWWLHEQQAPDGRPLDEAVLARVDGATVLSYRTAVTGPNGILDIGRHALAAGGRVGTPVRLAVDTRPLQPVPAGPSQTFHGCRRAEVDAALRATDAACARMPSYAGTAVHDVAGWRALRD